MDIYKALSIKELLGIKFLSSILPNIKDIELEHVSTNGLSGSNMYKLTLISDESNKKIFLKINNLKEDWVAKISKDKGRELTIFKESIYNKLEEFIKDVYLGYYQGNDSYAILMNDMSEYTTYEESYEFHFIYLDNLAKFHAKFKEADILGYEDLLNVDGYYNFLTRTKVNEKEEFIKDNEYGWEKLREMLGKELFDKYNNIENVDKLFSHYPKTFLHGDYRPANTLYINEDDIRFIDWANSGCGPCTLDLFWYIITSVDKKIDKIEIISYYKKSLERYQGYDFTYKTWDTLLKVGILCSCKMYLAAAIPKVDEDDTHSLIDLDWWIKNLKSVLVDAS